MSKRTLMLIVSLIASVALVAGGTLAYLTDTDSDVNVMTLGNVDIEQHEMKRAEDIANDAELEDGDLLPFEDGIKLYPAYPAGGEDTAYEAAADTIKWGPYVTAEGAEDSLFDDEALIGAVDKIITVENTGASDAYIRTLLAIEMPAELQDKLVFMRHEATGNEADIAWTEAGDIQIDGTNYMVWIATYQNSLPAGDTSVPSLLQVALKHDATNEDVALLGETFEILALSQAVQVQNLESLTPEEALNAAFNNGEAEIDSATLVEWFSGLAGMPVTTVSTAEELTDALAQGGTVVLTDDVELGAEQITLTEDTTLVLGDNTLTAEPVNVDKTYGVINIPAGVTLTVEGGEGQMVLDTNLSKAVSASIFQNDGELIINGGDYLATCNDSPSASIVAVVDNVAGGAGSSVTINGGTFAVGGTRCPNIIRNWPLSAGSVVELTINGGTFKANPDRPATYIWSKNDTAYNKEPAGRSLVTINGGTFEDIKLEVDGFVDDHYIDSSVTGIEIVEGGFNGYVDADGNQI